MDQYWILRPVPEHRNSHLWEASIFRDVALIKATSPDAARNWAARVFSMPDRGEPEAGRICSPWLGEEVSCVALRSYDFRHPDVNRAIGHFRKDMEAILRESGAVREREALRFISEHIDHFPDVWPRFAHKEARGYACESTGNFVKLGAVRPPGVSHAKKAQGPKAKKKSDICK